MNDLILQDEPSAARDRLYKAAEGLFDKTFQFYSSFISLTRQNKELIVMKESVKYFQQQNLDLEAKLNVALTEAEVVKLSSQEVRDKYKALLEECA